MPLVKILPTCFVVMYLVAVSLCYDPCCSFPCQNSAVCMSRPKGLQEYKCDCTGTGYYGPNCDTPYLNTRVKMWFKPSKDTLHYFLTHYKYLWKVVNNITWLRKKLMKAVLKIRLGFIAEPSPYRGMDNYPSWNGYTNDTMYVRSLPPIPENCPTPMGVKGFAKLPDPDYLVDVFLARKEFTPCPERTSVLFPFFAQHFTHQFFKTDPIKGFPFQLGGHAINFEHLYGDTIEIQNALRTGEGGKLKHQIINGEIYPPLIKDAGVFMAGSEKLEEKYRFAMGHSGFLIMPTFLVFQTIFLREHNRVCDILKEENPYWSDERIYRTARLVLIGEISKIIIEDYVQHLSGYHFNLIYDPELLHGEEISYHNQIHAEFQMLYHWHALSPDHVTINQSTFSTRELLFNPAPVVKSGIAQTVEDLSSQFAGKIGGGFNQGAATLHVAKKAIRDGRKMRLQSLNSYRIKFGLKPHKTFLELTGNLETAEKLKELYGEIDAVEFYFGMFIEKRRNFQLLGETIVEIGSPYSLKGILGNPIGSKEWWKPSTFGGERGFNIIKSASLQKLVCDNVAGPCPKVSFRVEDDIPYTAAQTNPLPNKDNTSAILMKIARGEVTHDTHLEKSEETLYNDKDENQVSKVAVASKLKTEL